MADPQADPEPFELRSGDVLAGKYLLVEPLAAGGMGQIWRARNLTTNAEVAAKVLHVAHASPEGLARFRREARATAALYHRAIVRVFDLVELDPARGSLLLVMELLRGRTLCDRLEEHGPLSVAETLEIVTPLLSALSHAHERGIVHRDLKPENVFLALEPDGTRLPKLVDFGISKVIRERPITQNGQIVGTLNYMSPEQTLAGVVDERSDLFSVGVLLYECLAGRNPFARPGDGDAGPDLLSVFHVEPPPLPHIPVELWHVIRRALAKKVEDRFTSAEELACALSAAIPPSSRASDPLRLTPLPTVVARVSGGPRDHASDFPPLVAGVAVLALLGVLALTSSGSRAPAKASGGHAATAAAEHAKHLVAQVDRLAVVAERALDASPQSDSFATARAPERLATPPRPPRSSVRHVWVLRDPGF